MVLKTMSSNEVKQRWGSVMSTAKEVDNAVIVESHGTPMVAVIPYGEFEQFQKFKLERRRTLALQRFRELQERIGDRNQDLTDEEIEDIAVRAGREINRAAAARQREIVRQKHEP